MITKEDILAALEASSWTSDKITQIYGLALKGLESESTVKQVTQDRDTWKMMHEDLVCVHRIAVLRRELMLQNERDESNAKTKTIFEASKIINDAQEKHRDLEDELTNFKTRYDQLCREHLIQNDHLRNGRRKAEDQIGVLEDKLKDTVTRQYHDGIVVSAARQIALLRDERNAFQRLVGELQTENHCKRADLENVCEERDDLRVSIDDAQVKNLDLKIQNNYLKAAIAKTEDQIAMLEDKLKDTVTLKHHYELVNSAKRQNIYLKKERDAFQRLVGELQTENHCKRSDLENVCKERDDLKSEIEKWEEAHCSKNALTDKLFTENEELKIRIEKFEAFFTGED